MTTSIYSANRSKQRQERAERHLTTKGDAYGRCIRQEHYQVGTTKAGKPIFRVRYLHVTKGWRDRTA
jgi:hypothetical protein